MVKNFAAIIVLSAQKWKTNIYKYYSVGPNTSQRFALSKQQFYSRQFMLRLQSKSFYKTPKNKTYFKKYCFLKYLFLKTSQLSGI